MKLSAETEANFKEVGEIIDYLKEKVTSLGTDGHIRLALSDIDKLKRTLKNWSTQ